MPSHPTRRLIEQRCKDLCDRLGLAQLYVTQVIGRRRHYLAGHGCPLSDRPEQMSLSSRVDVFWHGNMTEPARKSLKADLKKLTAFVEELIDATQSSHPEGDSR